MGEALHGYGCSGCGYAQEEEPEDPIYECGSCGMEFSRSESEDGGSNRCPSCYKFSAKTGTFQCPQCVDVLYECDDCEVCPQCEEWNYPAGCTRGSEGNVKCWSCDSEFKPEGE